jgi:hypothetical protein
MEQQLKDIKLIISGLIYQRDIEDIVFDNNGHKNNDPDKCHGKRVLDGYNSQAIVDNSNNLKKYGRKTGLDKEIFTIDNTKHFCIGWIKPKDNNNVGYNVMTYYYKEIIIMETTQNCVNPNPPTYKGFRHYFTPDVLLFLKHFHKTQNTDNAMTYIRQNPHYFKHHTTNTYALVLKAHNTIEEIIHQNKRNMDNTYKLTHKLLVLELENKVLKNKISEMETEKSRDVSFTLPKTKTE